MCYQETFKNCAPFTDFVSKINTTEIENTKDVDTVMPTYNLRECSNIYSKTSWSLWQHYRKVPALIDADIADNFPGKKVSFKFKQKITLRNLGMPFINCEINFVLKSVLHLMLLQIMMKNLQ